MTGGTNHRSKWGQAKASVSVLADDIKNLKDEGLSSHEIYLRLASSGKTTGFSRASFYRWLRLQFPQEQKRQQSKAVAINPLPAAAPAVIPPRPALPSPYQSTIQPATPLTGTPNGSPLLLGDDDDGTN